MKEEKLKILQYVQKKIAANEGTDLEKVKRHINKEDENKKVILRPEYERGPTIEGIHEENVSFQYQREDVAEQKTRKTHLRNEKGSSELEKDREVFLPLSHVSRKRKLEDEDSDDVGSIDLREKNEKILESNVKLLGDEIQAKGAHKEEVPEKSEAIFAGRKRPKNTSE